jgi:hypothetical protein
MIVKFREKLFLMCMIECMGKAFERLVACDLKSMVSIKQ